MDLPTRGMLYQSSIGKITVKHLLTYEEDILCTPSLINSGKVWEILYNMLVEEHNDLPWDSLYFLDRFAFMLQVRINTYGADVEYEIKNGGKVIEKYNFKLDELVLPTPDYGTMDGDGLFSFMLPISKKNVKYRLLTAKENEDLLDTAKKMSNSIGLPYTQEIKYRLSSHIVEVDGERDRNKIDMFLESGEMSIQDSVSLRKDIKSKVPEPNLMQEVKTDKGNVFMKELDINTAFFFPSLFL